MAYERRGAYCRLGQRAYSYDTCIIDVLPDGRTIGNDTRYSVTTSKHQRIAGVRHCVVVVTGVPRGTDDLAGWYARQPAGQEVEAARR